MRPGKLCDNIVIALNSNSLFLDFERKNVKKKTSQELRNVLNPCFFKNVMTEPLLVYTHMIING